jgi:PhoH-like ATPase
MDNTDRKLFILDTNVLLHEPLAIYSFKEHDVLIPMTVLEELDNIKDRHKDVSRDARIAIRALEDVFRDATPEQIAQGVALAGEASGHISIFSDHHLPQDAEVFTDKEADNRIINAALYLQKHEMKRQVVLVTKDINMRLKAKEQVLPMSRITAATSSSTTSACSPRASRWCPAASGSGSASATAKPMAAIPFTSSMPTCWRIHVNQYLLDEENFFAARVLSHDSQKIRLKDLGRERLMSRKAWGSSQERLSGHGAGCAARSAHRPGDPDRPGGLRQDPAGHGRGAGAGDREGDLREGDRHPKYPEIAESIGFLPGTEEEKMMPWLAAVTDTLEVLHKQDENMSGSLSYIMEKANIQFKSVNFMRGRSIQNTFVLLDECQNLTASQIKTIITRCGEGTKIVCSGNLAQIDSNYLSPVTSGLTYIVERFKTSTAVPTSS